jgi:hypothetical protein
MNERIRELLTQSGVIDNWNEADWYSMSPVMVEKFAELIVQECIDIIAPYSVRMIKPGEEYLHPILEIKQHFGVEE